MKPSNILLNARGEVKVRCRIFKILNQKYCFWQFHSFLFANIFFFKVCDFSVSGQLVKSCADTYVGTMHYMAVSGFGVFYLFFFFCLLLIFISSHTHAARANWTIPHEGIQCLGRCVESRRQVHKQTNKQTNKKRMLIFLFSSFSLFISSHRSHPCRTCRWSLSLPAWTQCLWHAAAHRQGANAK